MIQDRFPNWSRDLHQAVGVASSNEQRHYEKTSLTAQHEREQKYNYADDEHRVSPTELRSVPVRAPRQRVERRGLHRERDALATPYRDRQQRNGVVKQLTRSAHDAAAPGSADLIRRLDIAELIVQQRHEAVTSEDAVADSRRHACVLHKCHDEMYRVGGQN